MGNPGSQVIPDKRLWGHMSLSSAACHSGLYEFIMLLSISKAHGDLQGIALGLKQSFCKQIHATVENNIDILTVDYHPGK